MKNLKQTEVWDQVLKKLNQFKFAIAIALVGVVLLMIPTKPLAAKQDPATPAPELEPASQAEGYSTQEQQLAQILSMIDGAGQVQVMLTYKSSEKLIFQTDTTQSVNQKDTDQTTDTKTQTVLVSSGSSQQQAVVQQTIYPACQGAVVVCQGAGNPQVKLDVVNAVSSLTGLGSDKITVVKMKSK